jgi:hypothetical protein
MPRIARCQTGKDLTAKYLPAAELNISLLRWSCCSAGRQVRKNVKNMLADMIHRLGGARAYPLSSWQLPFFL